MDIVTVIVEKGNKGTDQIIPKGMVMTKRQILVCLNYDVRKVIGTARLYIERGVIKAILSIDKDKYLDLYPGIGYKIIKQRGNKITDFEILQIGLSKNLNEDATIKMIGEQIK